MESIINIILTFLIFFTIKSRIKIVPSQQCFYVGLERLLKRCKGVFPADLLSDA